MIKLDDAEAWAFNVLNSTCNNNQAELNRALAARNAYIQLLESKYKAVFDAETGQLKPKEKTEEDAV